eukprot:1159696-Pelagomonas_calceolata.AAC.3
MVHHWGCGPVWDQSTMMRRDAFQSTMKHYDSRCGMFHRSMMHHGAPWCIIVSSPQTRPHSQ